jgi:Skp family chaperone for outer membrane proteins
MKRNFARIFPVCALATILFGFAVIGNAQAAAPAGAATGAAGTGAAVTGIKIGVVDMQAAILSCNEGQRDFGALQKKFEPKKNEIDGLTKEVNDLKNQYSTQQEKLNPEARDNLLKQIDAKQKSLNRTVEDAQGDAQGQQQEIVNRIGQKMYGVLEKYAKENNFALVLDVAGQQNPVLWASETTNITPALVKAYNETSGVAAPPPSAPSAGRPAPTGTTPRPAGAATKAPATTTPHKP